MNISENKKEITARYPSEYIYIMVGLTGIGFFLFAYLFPHCTARTKGRNNFVNFRNFSSFIDIEHWI